MIKDEFKVKIRADLDVPVPNRMTRAEIDAFNMALACASEIASRRGEYYGYNGDTADPVSNQIAERCMTEFFNVRDEIDNMKIKVKSIK